MVTSKGQALSTFSLRQATHAVILREMAGSFRSPKASRRAMADDATRPSEVFIVLGHGVESAFCSHCAVVGNEGKSRKLCVGRARVGLPRCDWLASHLILSAHPHAPLIQYLLSCYHTFASLPMLAPSENCPVFVPHARPKSNSKHFAENRSRRLPPLSSTCADRAMPIRLRLWLKVCIVYINSRLRAKHRPGSTNIRHIKDISTAVNYTALTV